MSTPDLDPFWVKNRADFLAKLSTHADPNACGTCRNCAEAGEPVKHDGCQQRATLLQAPDHPYYEILAGFSLEENEKLPPRFHIPVFDDCGVPNSWLCAVCQEEGQVVGWPCATAVKYGTQVFTPLHEAETAQKKQSAELEQLRAELAAVRAERDEARRQVERRTEDVAFLERNTLPDLRRQIQHHQDGKKRWRERAEKAEDAKLRALEVLRVWRDEREAGPETARLLYEVGAALTDEEAAS